MTRPRRQFHSPIPAIFTRPTGPTLSDIDLRRAWSHVSTDHLRRLCSEPGQPDHVIATRRRMLALRQTQEILA